MISKGGGINGFSLVVVLFRQVNPIHFVLTSFQLDDLLPFISSTNDFTLAHRYMPCSVAIVHYTHRDHIVYYTNRYC